MLRLAIFLCVLVLLYGAGTRQVPPTVSAPPMEAKVQGIDAAPVAMLHLSRYNENRVDLTGLAEPEAPGRFETAEMISAPTAP